MSVIPFPRHHQPASRSACIPASASNVIELLPRLRAACTKASQCPGGIRSRRLQLETTGAETPNSRATLVVPPSSLMMAPTDMVAIYFTNREDVKPHDYDSDIGESAWRNLPMPNLRKEMGNRLRQTRLAMPGGPSQADICRDLDIAPNTWNQYEKGERGISHETLHKLKTRYGIPSDWIINADPNRLPGDILDNLRKVRAA